MTCPISLFPLTNLDESKTPLVIVGCGSFSPITYLHLRMFEMARDYVIENTNFEILGGYFSPVSDFYQKQGLAQAKHRVRMCELAVEKSSSWLMVDSWESLQTSYQRTAIVLDHFQQELNGPDGEGGVRLKNGKLKSIKIMLLAGGDLVQSFAAPDVWATADLHHIIGKYGCLILERTGSDVYEFLLSHDVLYKHRHNVFVIKQLIYNDISSTKIRQHLMRTPICLFVPSRLFIRRGMSIKYLLPTAVIEYIYDQGLYKD
ncbi:hypothetical protein B0O80DRAFT_384321 [Mortierella sp. GBAus27b]|nr:hypothetical protein B0O80DRAFT_384321 [Mortierella sp. GBAus27b]